MPGQATDSYNKFKKKTFKVNTFKINSFKLLPGPTFINMG